MRHAHRARRARGPRPAVELEVRDHIAWITLARPATGNRCDPDLLGALAEACATVEHAPEATVAVLRAQGASFSAGGEADGSAPDGILSLIHI